jgi:hypothetical protein
MKQRGIVKGQTIVFDEPLGLPEGQVVEVDIYLIDGPISNDLGDTEPDRTPAETDDKQTGSPKGRSSKVFPAIPAGGRLVTNEKVNEIREQLGI